MNWLLAVDVWDENGLISHVHVEFPDAMSFAQVEEAGGVFTDLVKTLTIGGVGPYTVMYRGYSPTGQQYKSSYSDNQEKALFLFRTEGEFACKRYIPAIDESKMIPNTGMLDLTDADVAAFLSAMTDGVVLSDLSVATPVDYRGKRLAKVVLGEEVFTVKPTKRKRRRILP